jgi:hypothetical protein
MLASGAPSKQTFLFTTSHCAFSSNLFHGQIAEIYIDQLSDPENKKCSPWKVFGTNHPKTLRLLSRRGPRKPEARLSQHYIDPKMTFRHFSNFCRKNFADLIKEISCTHWMNLEVLPHGFCKLQPPKLYKNVQKPFCQAGKLFSAEIWKMAECHFWANVMLRQSRLRASRASPAQKSQVPKTVQGLHFLFSGPLRWSIYIWAICPWNKFDEKAQCVPVFPVISASIAPSKETLLFTTCFTS